MAKVIATKVCRQYTRAIQNNKKKEEVYDWSEDKREGEWCTYRNEDLRTRLLRRVIGGPRQKKYHEREYRSKELSQKIYMYRYLTPRVMPTKRHRDKKILPQRVITPRKLSHHESYHATRVIAKRVITAEVTTTRVTTTTRVLSRHNEHHREKSSPSGRFRLWLEAVTSGGIGVELGVGLGAGGGRGGMPPFSYLRLVQAE